MCGAEVLFDESSLRRWKDLPTRQADAVLLQIEPKAEMRAAEIRISDAAD